MEALRAPQSVSVDSTSTAHSHDKAIKESSHSSSRESTMAPHPHDRGRTEVSGILVDLVPGKDLYQMDDILVAATRIKGKGINLSIASPQPHEIKPETGSNPQLTQESQDGITVLTFEFGTSTGNVLVDNSHKITLDSIDALKVRIILHPRDPSVTTKTLGDNPDSVDLSRLPTEEARQGLIRTFTVMRELQHPAA